MAFWKKDDKGYKIETSKRGENYFSVLKVNDEVVLTVISPPGSFGSDTQVNVSGGMDPTSEGISGAVKVGREKGIIYNDPIILFNPNNSAGLQRDSVISAFQSQLKQEDPNQEKFKVDPISLGEHKKFYDIKDESHLTIGSTIVEFSKNQVSLRPSLSLSHEDKETIDLILQYIVKGLMKEKGTFRANIMLYNPESKKLKISASYNMDGYRDKDLEIDVDQGGAGTAFRKKDIEVVDLYKQTHRDYNIDPNKVWDEMKSIISVPLLDSNQNSVGVLSIDSNKLYQEAKFHDPHLQNLLRMQAEVLERIIEYARPSELE